MSTSPRHFDPTPEGWAAFRAAMVTDARAPVLGGHAYHYAPGRPTRIASAQATDAGLEVALVDGRTVRAPWAWFPILNDATPAERAAVEVDEQGTWLWFPRLNTEVMVDQLLVCFDGADEVAFITACASTGGLVDIAAALVRRAAQERGREVEDILGAVRSEAFGGGE